MAYIAQLKSLHTLGLSYCHLTDNGLARLAALRSLSSLQLALCEDIAVSDLARLNVLPQLTQLTLLNCGRQDNKGLDVSGLTKLKQLSLWLSTGSLRDEDLACLANLTELESVNLGPCEQVTDVGAAQLSGLTSLRRLFITKSPHLTDKSLSYLENMNALEDLAIEGNFTDEGLRRLEGHKALTGLEIGSGHDFSRPALERLAKNLPRLEHFRTYRTSSQPGTVRTPRK